MKKTLSLFLMAVLLVGVLAACGPKRDVQQPKESQGTTEKAEKTGQTGRLGERRRKAETSIKRYFPKVHRKNRNQNRDGWGQHARSNEKTSARRTGWQRAGCVLPAA